mgnify:CR=1 FL=1
MSIYGAALTRNSIDNNSLNYHEKELDEKILQTLYGGPNIVKLLDVVRDQATKTPCLVFEYIPNIETKLLIH